MLVKISEWDGIKMHPIRTQKVNVLNDILDAHRWMNDNNIHGGFEIICENETEECFLKAVGSIGV